MFASGANYQKLKTNLRLAINRLKLSEKKKTELALKARKEIADFLAIGKTERAKIRVEHIIREDYLVEAMEVVEMYCDLLLARFGLIQQMKDLDEGLAEAISSLIWVAPRLQTDIAEVKVISEQLTLKYGKPYAQACREQAVGTVSEKLIHKLSVQAPPKILVEKYLVEIAKNYNIEYEPDPQIMRENEWGEDPLINLNELRNDLGGHGGGATGGGGTMNIPPYPESSQKPFAYPQKVGFSTDDLNLPGVPDQPYVPSPGGPPPPDMSADTMSNNFKHSQGGMGGPYPGGMGAGVAGDWDELMNASPPPPYSSSMEHHNIAPASAPPGSIPPNVPSMGSRHNLPAAHFPPDLSANNGRAKESNTPKPAPRSKFDEDPGAMFNLPELPSVPDMPGDAGRHDNNSSSKDDEIDFDDLNKRFEELKRKK